MSDDDQRVPYARVRDGRVVIHFQRGSRCWDLDFLYSEGVFQKDPEPPESEEEKGKRADTEKFFRRVSQLQFRGDALRIRPFIPTKDADAVGGSDSEIIWRQQIPNSWDTGGKLARQVFHRHFKVL